MRHLPVRSAGFTLLELMITSLLGALLLMGATAMFGLFMRNSSATNIRKQINQEGQQVLSVIEFNLRNARTVSGCSTSTASSLAGTVTGGQQPTVRFTNKDGIDTIYERSTHIRLTQQGVGTFGSTFNALHSGFVVSTGGFSCSPTSTPSTVAISFTLTSGGVSQTFSSTVQIRNVTIR